MMKLTYAVFCWGLAFVLLGMQFMGYTLMDPTDEATPSNNGQVKNVRNNPSAYRSFVYTNFTGK